MNFAEAVLNESKKTYTENGATAYNTTDSALVDLYSTIGSLRDTGDARIQRLFSEAYNEDKLLATKILFYARDIRGGLGERKTFRTLINYMAKNMPEALKPNLDLIGVFGRYDDLYALVGTPLEDDMWRTMKSQLDEDRDNLVAGNAISLLAKWIKSADASSKNTRKLGILTAQKLGYNVYEFKRIIKVLRNRIGIVESLMSTGRWDEIKYPEVPSRAMKIYRKAFMNHDEERFNEFVQKAVTGEVKINSSTLYPYDIVHHYLFRSSYMFRSVSSIMRLPAKPDDVLEAQWNQLPNFVQKGSNALVIADTSGSMTCSGGRPIATAVGLAIYFAERNSGPYHNLWMSFSDHPHFHRLKGGNLYEKIDSLDMNDWGSSTNMEAAFDMVLGVAIEHGVSPEEMPKALIVITDMEINECCHSYTSDDQYEWCFYDEMSKRYSQNGYTIPAVIFWNVNSRNDVFHADAHRKGVQLVSGQSTTVFKQMMDNIGLSAYDAMLKVLNSECYDCITVG